MPKKFPILSIVAFLLLLGASAVNAETFTQTAVKDTTFAGNPGKIVLFEEVDFTEEVALFEESGLWRVYAFRIPGEAWEIQPTPVYFVPSSSITIGQTWSFPYSDVVATTAEVVGMESVTVPAGIFPNAYRVEVRDTDLGPTSQLLEVFWVADGLGVVKSNGFLPDGTEDWLDELESYSVVGTGVMPMDIGNTWTYLVGDVVPLSRVSFGGLKAIFGDR